LPKTGLLQTLSSAYNSVDWRRNVLWSKERFFIFVDRLTAREDGDYSFELLWRTLGDVTLDANGGFTTDQMGESMNITRTDPSRCMVSELLDSHGTNYYGSYPYCRDGLVKTLRQCAAPHLRAGETYTYVNALQTYTTGWAPMEVKRLSDAAVLLIGKEGRVCAGVGQGQFPGGPQTDAALWIVDEGGMLSVAGGSRFQWGEFSVSWPSGGSVEVDLKSGAAMGEGGPVTVTLEGSRDLSGPFAAAQAAAQPPAPQPAPAELEAQDAKVVFTAPLPPGASIVTTEAGTRVSCEPNPLPESTWVPDYKIDPQRLAYSWDAVVLWKENEKAQVTITLPMPRDISRIAVRTMWTNNSKLDIRYRLRSLSIATAATANGTYETRATFDETTEHEVPSYPEYGVDTPGLKAQCIRITAEPQEGAALFLQGIRAWGKVSETAADRPDYQRWASGPVSALCAAKLGQSGADCVVYGCRDGKLTALEQGKELWSVEAGAQVNCLAAGDLTGDGKPELLVGTNGQRLLCLDATGKELWNREFPFFWGRQGNVMWVGVGDVDADGESEVVVSCENWHYYCLDAEGKDIWSFEIEHSGMEGALGDVNGDGKLETLCGEEYYGWSVLDSAGKRLFNVGGSGPITTAALAEDLTGDGIAEAAFGAQTFDIHVRDGKGAPVMDGTMPGIITDLAALDTDGGKLLLSGADCCSHNLAAFSPDGKAAWRVTLPGAPLALASTSGRIAAGCRDGALRLIGADGKVAAEARLQGPIAHLVSGDFDGDGALEVCGAGDRELVVVEM